MRAAPPGPGPTRQRLLAPDLARGGMLLLIALANTPYYFVGVERTLSSAHPVGGGVADRLTQAVIITAVDARVYPMFAFLFGYGIVQIYRRQFQAGVPEVEARRLLRRRHWWLLAFGFAHAALLWMGDILGTYAVLGLVLSGLFLRRRDSTLLVWVLVLVTLIVSGTLTVVGLGGLLQALVPAEAIPSDLTSPIDLAEGGMTSTSYLAAIPERLGVWVLVSLFQGLALVVPAMMLAAFWAARRGVLEQPWRFRRLLVGTAVGGIGIGWLGGLPHALVHTGGFAASPIVQLVFTSTQATTGMFCGVGYVAAFALLAERLGRRPLPMGARAVAACGQRSLSCYLAQSVLCAPLLAGWGLGLGAVLGSATMALLAVAVWLVTVAGAYALHRAGRNGPAEALLRRLTYGARPGAGRPDDRGRMTPSEASRRMR